MNQAEHNKWKADARLALSGKYNVDEIEIIMEWFRYMKGTDERDLLGHEELEHLLKAMEGMEETWDLYNSMMARLFIYAPLILREHESNNRNLKVAGA